MYHSTLGLKINMGFGLFELTIIDHQHLGTKLLRVVVVSSFSLD